MEGGRAREKARMDGWRERERARMDGGRVGERELGWREGGRERES